MKPRAKKIILLLLAVALLAGSGQMQKALNRDRNKLGLTRTDALKDAPPLLAFTTVALGGFRGLISNYLWIRASDLQQDDKFFEAAQLATWITELEPHFTQVWLFQGWNMAYNISVKFKDFADRWRWVERGIALLRDDGLRYNPNNILIHRELAWFFQHKMGQNLDDASVYYKQQWAKEMTPFFGPEGTNFSELIHPTTPEARTNAAVLREKFKIDPVFAQKVNEEYGPLDWRLPEAHAIYWGAQGLEDARKNPGKVKADDLITLRRIIYQSIYQAFKHGRLISDPFNKTYSLEPNLDLVPRVYATYNQMAAEETNVSMKGNILNAERNFLRDAVYFLYEDNRVAAAKKWYDLLAKKFPDNIILDGDPNSYPRNLTLDEYAVARVQEELGDTSQERTTGVVQGLLARAYYSLAIGQEDRYAGFKLLAGKVYQNYQNKIGKWGGSHQRIDLPPFAVINRSVLSRLLDPKDGMPYAMRAVLRTQLPEETKFIPESTGTNAPPAINTTNALPATVTNTPAGTPTNSAAE